MDKIIKLFIPCALLLIFISGCEDAEDTQTKTNGNQVTQEKKQGTTSGKKLLTPDDYNNEQARKHGYTVIHEDTDTSKDDTRCGNGGGRYSTHKTNLCDWYTDENDWYSESEAEQTNCPPGFTRVDQAIITRATLAGSTRQCRTTKKISTTAEHAHFYCPHGSNLVGYRTGLAAKLFGICRLRCDRDTYHLYPAECNQPKSGGSQSSDSKSGSSQSNPIATTSTTVTTTITTTTIPKTSITFKPFVPDIPSTTTIPNQPSGDDELPSSDDLLPEFPDLTIKSAPDGSGLHVVGIETWFWLSPSDWISRQKIFDHNDNTYTTTATPANLKIIITGPVTKRLDCGTSPGEPWTPQNSESRCSYAWKKAGAYKAVAKIRWTISWVCEPDCGTENLADITTQSLETTYRVTEVQALIQDPN